MLPFASTVSGPQSMCYPPIPRRIKYLVAGSMMVCSRFYDEPSKNHHGIIYNIYIYTSTIRENSITVFNRAESKNFPPVRFLTDFFFLVYNYTMTTKNDKEMSIKVDLRDKYDRKALTFINGFHRYGLISIKKSFVDRRRKYSSTVG